MTHWFRGGAKHQPPMMAEEEDHHLQNVERALLHLLNDDIAEADKLLRQQNSSYHHLGRGISSFIASMLGVEKELLKEAATVLQEAENKTWEDMKKAQREPKAFQSSIYPLGTEYQLCYAISQLTSAICAVLSGSIIEAVKGFRKLRQAYLTLDGIMEIEARYLKERVALGHASLTANKSSASLTSKPQTPVKPPSSRDGISAKPPSTVNSLDEKQNEISEDPHLLSAETEDLTRHPTHLSAVTRQESKLLDIDPASVGITNHTDIFIHSGTRLCYGMLLVIFSMIENPIFNKILYIVGFKGDRERGTRYLWQAARFENFNSAIAGIALLGYYNGLVGFCDILPTDERADDDLSGYPRARCMALLSIMRERYPDSRLWKMEEARMHSSNKNLTAAAKILAENSDSNMKQIATINMFERSLTTMSMHDYQQCASCWVECSELSKWSPTLYFYLAGVAYLELYRNTRISSPSDAKQYKKKATEYIKKGPPLAGQQKVMAKELPFDLYIVRKVKKWEERAKKWNIDLVDAIGVSPLTEMIYFWGGTKKQNVQELEKDLGLLDWERCTEAERFEEDLEEMAIFALLKACTLRNLGRFDEAKVVLEDEVLNHDRNEFKGPLNDDWMLPSANYEMACLAWQEKDLEGQDHNAKVLDCERWLDKTKSWPDQYVLDSRISVKITTSLLTVKRHKAIIGL